MPISFDVDCEGQEDGPVHVRDKNFEVVGLDVYELDPDGDGLACDD